MIDIESIRALLRREHRHAVSIFMPTHVAGREVRQDPIRFRNLVDNAAGRLLRAGMAKPDIQTMLAPAFALAADEDFWRHQEKGLAVFVAPGFSHHEKVPVEMPEEVVLGRHFHVKHLLPLVGDEARFWIVALSAGQARLFEATRHGCTEIEAGLPRGVAEIAAETGYESPPGGIPKSHSFGEDPEEQRKAQFVEYLHRVVARVEGHVAGQKAPLVVAAKAEARGHFKALAEKLGLELVDLDINPDAFEPADLHRRAWALVEHRFAEGRAAALDHINSLIGTGDEKATVKPEEIVKAARYGRIDTLFLAADEHLWGRFDEAQDRVEAHGSAAEDDEDLLDYAAGQTILQGGRVELLSKDELPRHGIMAAILRF